MARKFEFVYNPAKRNYYTKFLLNPSISDRVAKITIEAPTVGLVNLVAVESIQSLSLARSRVAQMRSANFLQRNRIEIN